MTTTHTTPTTLSEVLTTSLVEIVAAALLEACLAEPSRCADCGTTERVTVGPCPHDHDVHHDDTPVALCEWCYADRGKEV